LAAGDADIAATLAETSRLGHLMLDQAMTNAQRDGFLPKFLADDRYHLAFASHEPETRLGMNYHRPATTKLEVKATAVKSNSGGWILNGLKDCVANAPIAALFAVLVKIPGRPGSSVLLVPADAPGLIVRAHEKAWRHGPCGDVTFKDCRVSANNLLGDDAAALLTCADRLGRGNPLFQALNLGIGRAAYEAALDYAHLRVQGGRPIIEHQAIGTKLAEIAIGLEVSRTAIWQAAWASDHPAAIADCSLSDLPLQTMAQVFTSEMMLKATKDAAEVFGAMGVMRDMPLQKYVHDARVCLQSGDSNSDAKLRIAEDLAGYRRATNGAMAMAAE
jgi:alkylation response protein AidB-like acyl-CoA dehydrogenase